MDGKRPGMMMPLDILYEKVVTGIVDNGHNVTVTTSSGTTYNADVVAIALSLGVLKDNSITFSPDMTSEKKQAIQKTGNEPYCRTRNVEASSPASAGKTSCDPPRKKGSEVQILIM